MASVIESRHAIVMNEPHITTATGTTAKFNTDVFGFLDSLTVGVQFVQSGSGDPAIDNIRPIIPFTGLDIYRTGTNIFDNDNAGWVEKKYLNANGVEASNSSYHYTANYIPVCPNTSYTFSLTKSSASVAITVCKYDINKTFTDRVIAVNSSSSISQSGAITTDSDTYFVRFSCYDGATNVMIEVGSNEHSGYNSSMYKPYAGSKISFDWSSTAGNIYIGTLNVKTGVLTSTHAVKSFDGTESWSHQWGTETANGVFRVGATITTICPGIVAGDKYANFTKSANVTSNTTLYGMYFKLSNTSNPYMNIRNSMSAEVGNSTKEEMLAAWKALLAEQYENGTPYQLVYSINPSVTYQLTAQQVKSLVGENNIFADSNGNVEVKYWKH